jgi:hypothetical protein
MEHQRVGSPVIGRIWRERPARRRKSTRKIGYSKRWNAKRFGEELFFYLGAFYLTVPVPLVANFETAGTSYPYMLTAFILAPLRNFF